LDAASPDNLPGEFPAAGRQKIFIALPVQANFNRALLGASSD
jgi:hypothetical protein